MYPGIHSLPLDGSVGGHGEFQGSLDRTNLPGDACLVLTTDPKPRLRWTTVKNYQLNIIIQLSANAEATDRIF
uniref:Uncharacterized protein n=1 Tax=Rhizophora mucronata TaxID=61149 RepID=A0A2P2P8I3_RHIMU